MSAREKMMENLEKPRSFSELKEVTGLENGVLQYHIQKSSDIVEKKGALMPKNYCQECELRGTCENKCLLLSLSDSKKKRIAEFIDQGRSQRKIAEKLDISPATVNYHVSDLREKNILEGSEFSPEVKTFLK